MHGERPKPLMFVGILIVLGLLLGGCAPAAAPAPAAPAADAPASEDAPVADDGPKMGGTLIVGWNGEFTTLDCQDGNLFNSRITAHNVCETLVAEDTTSEGSVSTSVKPGLAESWEIADDGVTYTFHLRKNVKFTDGVDFNAEAVQISFDRWLNPESEVYDEETARGMSAYTKIMASYRVVDDYTFEIVLKEPFGPFIRQFKHRMYGITSPEALKQWTHEMRDQRCVGTGPFIVDEVVQGDHVTLVRNPDYWDKDAGGPYLDKIIYTVMPDDSARLAALKAGEIDVSIVIPADRVADLQEAENVHVAFPSHPHIMFWHLNHTLPEMQDLRVRQAVMHAINTEAMVESIFGENAVPMRSFLPPGNPGYRPDFESPYPYDPEKAKQLLEEAGWVDTDGDGVREKDGKPFEFILAQPIKAGSFSEPVQVAEFTQSYLKAVGIDAKVESYEYATFTSTFSKGLADLAHLRQQGWQSIADNPYMLDQVFHTNAIATNYNPGAFSNAEFDALLDEARLLGSEEALPLYIQAEDIFLREVGCIPILHDKQPRAYNTRVQDLKFGPSPWWEFTNVWLAE